jgi:APA family basic amino acid/polyamine antiporter
VLAAAYVVVSVVVSNPKNVLMGAILIGAGVPVFWYWQRRRPAQNRRA